MKTQTLSLRAPLFLADTAWRWVYNKETQCGYDIQLGRLIITGNALYIYIKSTGPQQLQ